MQSAISGDAKSSASGTARASKPVWYDLRTSGVVKAVLEAVCLSGQRIRLFYGDPQSGRAWPRDRHLVGILGHTEGAMLMPALFFSKQATKGNPVLAHEIVRIMDVTSRADLYRHPHYHLPAMTITPFIQGVFQVAVRADGVVVRRFKTSEEAQVWIEFVRGDRLRIVRHRPKAERPKLSDEGRFVRSKDSPSGRVWCPF